MKSLPISEVRANLPKLVDDIDRQFDRITLTKSGHPKAVLMSSEEYEEWVETLEIASNSKTMKAIAEAQKSIAKEGVVSHGAMLREINAT